MNAQTITFIHISDSHIGPTEDHRVYGFETYRHAEEAVRVINRLPAVPDFVVHTGDIVNFPDPASYRLASRVFSGIQVPVYYLAGNHDQPSDVRQYFKHGSHRPMDLDAGLFSYSFEHKGTLFVAVDARGPDEIDPHGVVSAPHLEYVRAIAASDARPLALFVHFPVLRVESAWFDRDMLLLNGEEFHRALLPARDRLRGVFFGHIHRGMHIMADGIMYSGVASTFCQFTAWPLDQKVVLDPAHPPAFNLVTLTPGATIVKEHTFERPTERGDQAS